MTAGSSIVIAGHGGGDLALPEELLDKARDYADRSRAANTKRAYAADWRDFNDWCIERGRDPLPAAPATVGAYLAHRAETLKGASLQRRLTAIAQAHRLAGHHLDTRHPAIRETWAGIRRTIGTAQQGKAPACTADIRAMVGTLGSDMLGIRDR